MLAAVFTLAGAVVEAGFDLRIVCRELARLTRDLMVVKIDPTRLRRIPRSPPRASAIGCKALAEAVLARRSHARVRPALARRIRDPRARRSRGTSSRWRS